MTSATRKEAHASSAHSAGKEARIYMRIDPEIKRQAMKKSHRTGITLTHIVTQALKAWIEQPDS